MTLITKEQYFKVKAAWSKIHTFASAEQHIIYNILRRKSPTNGFIARQTHIQADDPWYGYNVPRVNLFLKLTNASRPEWIEHYKKQEEKVTRNKQAIEAMFDISLSSDQFSEIISILGDKK